MSAPFTSLRHPAHKAPCLPEIFKFEDLLDGYAVGREAPVVGTGNGGGGGGSVAVRGPGQGRADRVGEEAGRLRGEAGEGGHEMEEGMG